MSKKTNQKKTAAKPAKKATAIKKKETKVTEKKVVKQKESKASVKKSASEKKVKATKPLTTKASKPAKNAPDKKSEVKISAPVVVTKKEAVSISPRPAIQQKSEIKAPKVSGGKGGKEFKIGDYAIYPSHGLGKIIDIEEVEVLNQNLRSYLMYFEKERLTIKIPINSSKQIGLRHLTSKSQMDEVFVVLRSGVKKLKGMWSRRAQEYETKINSGDIILLAEVLRDLTRDIEDSERSYSERIIYETATYRLGMEYATIYGVSFEEAKEKIILTAKDKIDAIQVTSQDDNDFDDFDVDSDEDDKDEDEDEESEDEDDEEGGDEDGDDDEDDDY